MQCFIPTWTILRKGDVPWPSWVDKYFIFYIYLFIYFVGYSYRKRRLVLQICYQILCRLNLMIVVPKTLMIKMDKVRLLKKTSLMIKIMRFFYIKREYDTSLKATLEPRRLILRGSLEIHVYDFVILMGLLLCTSQGSIDLSPEGWKD